MNMDNDIISPWRLTEGMISSDGFICSSVADRSKKGKKREEEIGKWEKGER